MKKYEGFKAEAGGSYPILKPGPYIAEIRGVHLEGEEPDQSLILRLEVTEGPDAGYFTRRYEYESENSTRYSPRYRGDFRLRVPNLDNTNDKWPQTTLRRFQDAIYRIESSDPGYTWDWDEQSLVGKAVGINMREGTYNDVTYTSISRLETVDEIRAGLVKAIRRKEPQFSDDYNADAGSPPDPAAASADSVQGETHDAGPRFTVVDDPDLPF